jgi:hypothetical protein
MAALQNQYQSGQKMIFKPKVPWQALRGITLIEVAVLLLVAGVMLVPILKLTGGNTSAEGNVTTVSGNASREMVLANNQIERVLGSDLSAIDCGAGVLKPSAR